MADHPSGVSKGDSISFEVDSITEVDEATRDAWGAQTASQTRERLREFETGEAPFRKEATVVYGEDVGAIEAAVSAVDPDNAA